LARQVRRIAGRMRRKDFESHIAKVKSELNENMRKGMIDGVKDALNELFNIMEKKEDYLYIIEKDELILLNEEEKKVREAMGVEKELKSFWENLAKSNPDLFDNFQRLIDDESRKVMERIHMRTDQIRRVLAYLKADNVRGISWQDFVNTVRSERGLEKSIRKEAKYEKKDVKAEQSGIHKLYVFLDEIRRLVKENKVEEAEKKVEELLRVEKEIFERMKEEADYIYDIITKDTYLYARLLEFLKEDVFGGILLGLREDKYPKSKLDELNKKVNGFVERVYNHVKTIYGLGRYQEIHAR